MESSIRKYGEDIFKEKCCSNKYEFIRIPVNNRVRIMHIKREKRLFLDGNQSILYAYKLNLLYRKILLEMLGIKQDNVEKN